MALPLFLLKMILIKIYLDQARILTNSVFRWLIQTFVLYERQDFDYFLIKEMQVFEVCRVYSYWVLKFYIFPWRPFQRVTHFRCYFCDNKGIFYHTHTLWNYVNFIYQNISFHEIFWKLLLKVRKCISSQFPHCGTKMLAHRVYKLIRHTMHFYKHFGISLFFTVYF